MIYLETEFELKDPAHWNDIFIAELAELGFESFVETKTGFSGYIPKPDYKPDMLDSFKNHEAIIHVHVKEIPEQNWNAEWEKNFDPVFVENKLAIIAPFHEAPSGFEQIIVITPKMSFGTGHHQTTWLMSRELFNLNLKGKQVLDMGTGTGVLAILAEKLGASHIYAPDIDTWSYENALENCTVNGCHQVEVALGDHHLIEGKFFHFILANINKNVLLSHFSVYSAVIEKNGQLLISGFFETDCDDLIQHASKHQFSFVKKEVKDEWAMLIFNKIG